MKNRQQLLVGLESNQADCLTRVKSLNLWSKGGHQKDYWVAGVLHKLDSRILLLGQNCHLVLENISNNIDVKYPNLVNSTYSWGDLKSGDKIAVKILNDSVIDLMLISMNMLSEPADPFLINTKLEMQDKWEKFLLNVFSFFKKNNFVHLPTPNLVTSTGMEASLFPFSTELQFGEHKKNVFLPTSPEFHLKQALADGLTEVFEITPCFRNNELGFQHLPEFTMLEWYRAYDGLETLIEDIRSLVKYLLPEEEVKINSTSINVLFKKYLNYELTPSTTKPDLLTLAKNLEIQCEESDSWDDIYFLIFISKIEKHLGFDGIDIVYNYPPSQSALAKINQEGWADRFEMYWKGYEVANAFNELTCPKEQVKRFEKEQIIKKNLGQTVVPPIDEDFIKALERGVPGSAGIALGLERLFMALFKFDDIRSLKYFDS